MLLNAFSAVIPVDYLVLISFMAIVSPLQILMIGISYKDVGYDYLHRIYGEYKRNNGNNGLFNRYNILYMLGNAIFDFTMLWIITWQ